MTSINRPWVIESVGSGPLVLDSPHSGTWYPDDFAPACPLPDLRRAEDTHVDALYAFAPGEGVGWVQAQFPRSYLDVNRDLTEVDTALLADTWPHPVAQDAAKLAKVRLGKGLIWRLTDAGQPIYGRLLSAAEVQRRIDLGWHPYHAAVAQAIGRARSRHGWCVHVNCHSMPAVSGTHATDFPGLAHPDFVVGNRDHTTSAPAVAHWMCDWLAARGYSVWLNHPYKGVELVRRHGAPAQGVHSVQLEINRNLYMDEATLATHDGFAPLQRTLVALVAALHNEGAALCAHTPAGPQDSP
jgi:N-formylglutamate deformylase